MANENLDVLYREHARYIAGVAIRVLGRDDEVNDVVQDVFVQAMRDLSQLRDQSAVKFWLARITVRTARRRLRKRRVWRLMLGDSEYTYAELADPGLSPEQGAHLARLYQALDDLSVECRLAWSLRHIEGHSLTDVASMCDCSLATAKRRIARAAKELKKRLGDA